MQGRLLADPPVRADPGGFADELRSHGRLVRGRAAWLTADHALAHQLLRSDDFSVTAIGKTLPGPLGWLEQRTTVKGRLHPLLPPSLLSVEPPEHTRYRKTVSSVFTTRAVAALRVRVEQAALDLLDGVGGAARPTVDIVDRYCSQLPVTVIGDILGVPDHDRPASSSSASSPRPASTSGCRGSSTCGWSDGLDGFNAWLADHIRHLQRNPGDDLMSQIIAASDDGARLDDEELRATAGLVLAAGFETTVNLLGNGIRILLEHPDQLAMLLERTRAVAGCGRGDPAAGVAGAAERADRPRRHRGGRPPDRRAANSSSSTSPAPTATPRCSPTRTASTSPATTRASTCRSPAAGTSAWARRWPGPRARSGCGRSSTAIRTRAWRATGAGATPGCCADGRRCRSRSARRMRRYFLRRGLPSNAARGDPGLR